MKLVNSPVLDIVYFVHINSGFARHLLGKLTYRPEYTFVVIGKTPYNPGQLFRFLQSHP